MSGDFADELRYVRQGTAEAVELVGHDCVNTSFPNRSH
jgi:hypothetical protein